MIRVIGIGSPHGDDQVGWRLVKELGIPEGPSVRSSLIATPMDLLDTLDGADILVLVDACVAGLSPGTVIVRDWPCDCDERGTESSHGLGVDVVLRLAESLGRLPRRVKLFGVQSSGSEPLAGFGPEVERAWPTIVEQLRKLIRELGAGP
jgi:hydrogenase maturation protease